MLGKYEANSQEINNKEAQSQQSLFATLLKSHPRTYMPPKIRSTPAEHPFQKQHLWRNFSVCFFIKYLNYKVLLFAVVKNKFINTKNE